MKAKEQIKTEIEKLQNQLKEIEEREKKELSTLKFRKFKSLSVEVSQIIDWDKPYNEIPIPEDCRLINIIELITLLESDEEDKFLGEYKNKDNLFWIKQRKYDKLNNYSCCISLVDGGSWDTVCVNPENSYDGGRVVFVKDKK